jgi:hypothetical protein
LHFYGAAQDKWGIDLTQHMLLIAHAALPPAAFGAAK